MNHFQGDKIMYASTESSRYRDEVFEISNRLLTSTCSLHDLDLISYRPQPEPGWTLLKEFIDQKTILLSDKGF